MPTKPKTPAKNKTAKKVAKKAAGRPTKRTARVVKRILDGLSKGIPLSVLCRPSNMPGVTTVWEWQQKDAGLSVCIARARESGYDMIAMDALKIADTPREGVETTMKPTGRETRKGDMLGHRKLQVETRLKLLAKWDPKRYGERVTQEISGPDGKPIRSETSHVVSEELEAKILERTMEAARFAAGVEAPASFRGKGSEE